MSNTITTDFVGNETATVTRQRLTDILGYHGFNPAAYANWGAARGDINVMLAVAGQTLLTNEEIAASFLPKLNAINRASLAAQRLFAAGEQGAWFDPGNISTLFQDVAGTIPVTAPGQTVARINDRSGRGNHATQATAASRPVYGVQPRSGVRNLAHGSADVGNNAFWPATQTTGLGITTTKVASGIDIDGLPYVDLRYSGTATGGFVTIGYVSANSRAPANSGQSFTTSVLTRLIAGSTANCTLRVSSVEETAPATYISETASALAATNVEQTLSATRTITTGNQARAQLTLTFSSGAVLDATFRIKALQFEQGAARTAYQRNFSALNVTEDGVPTVGFLQFDGVDDFMQTAGITAGTDKAQVFAGVRKFSDAVRGMITFFGGPPGRINIEGPSNTALGHRYTAFSAGTSGAAVATTSPAFDAPQTVVLTGLGDISGDQVTMRINAGVNLTSTGDQGTGNYATSALSISAASNPFNGRLFSLIQRFGPNLSPAEITRTETWVNSRTGAY